MSASSFADDLYLTIGGGYAPSENQASLERNVLFSQRVLAEKKISPKLQSVFFADGDASGADLQVIDRKAIPTANQLMAEFFGSQTDLGLSYRNHRVPHIQGGTSLSNIRRWFKTVGPTMQSGDRLFLYVTSHGSASNSRSQPYNTSISLWNNERLDVVELVKLLDGLPEGVSVVAVMVQCHAGGFARFIYNEGNPERGLSTQPRCGFFATVHDRPAAGCTPDVDEATYVEYSTYFWEAIAGHNRLNQPVESPDYNGDGKVSFDEAHAYTLLSSDTIDLPISTSSEFLSIESRFQSDQDPELLPRDLDYDEVLELATPSDRAVLEGLSEQLDLSGQERLAQAERLKNDRRSQRRGRYRGRPEDPASRLRRQIAGDLKKRWPELANLMNPVSIELLTTRSEDFVHAVEVHPEYSRYRELTESETNELDAREQLVKVERFILATENVILRENLVRIGDVDAISHFQRIVENESCVLGN
ncbi:hypothetical protein [Aporhodopirellula aestuarii]